MIATAFSAARFLPILLLALQGAITAASPELVAANPKLAGLVAIVSTALAWFAKSPVRGTPTELPPFVPDAPTKP